MGVFNRFATEDYVATTAENIEHNLAEIINEKTDESAKSYAKIYVDEEISGLLGTTNVTLTGMSYDINVKSVNHRGYSAEAPENTIPAYVLSKKKGFTYVECDVSFTLDNVAVLLHDSTIDRTSNGTGNISEMTYVEASQYDFGSWKSAEYTGVNIPTFEEFIKLCKCIGLHPYIELKSNGNYTQEQIVNIVNTVEKNGMKGKVTYISFSATFLEYVKEADDEARLGYLVDISSDAIITANELKSGKNEVFIDTWYGNASETNIQMCIDNELPVEIWTVNSADIVENMHQYISGVTSDNLIAGKVLYNQYLSSTNSALEPIVNLSLANVSDGVLRNLGTGGSHFDSSIVEFNGTYQSDSEGLIINNHAYANVNYPLVNHYPFTLAIKGEFVDIGTNQYVRLFRTNIDAPSLFYRKEGNNIGIKVNGSGASTSTIYVSEAQQSNNTILINDSNLLLGSHLYVITGNVDENLMSLYIDGRLIATQPMNHLSPSSYIGVGDNDETKTYYANKIKITDFRIWNKCLSDKHIRNL